MSMPDPQTAFTTLASTVHNRIIFEKVAAATGVVPETEKQAQDILDIASMLFAAHSAGSIKTAAEAYDPIGNAKDSLVNALGFSNEKTASHDAESDLAVALMQNPALYDSVVSLKAAEAMELQAALRSNQ